MLDDFLTQIGPEEGEEEYEMMQEYFKSCKRRIRDDTRRIGIYIWC